MAVFHSLVNYPVFKEVLTIFVTTGKMISIPSFRMIVGIESDSHDFVAIDLMIVLTSSYDNSLNFSNAGISSDSQGV